MSFAFAGQMNGLGFWLCPSMYFPMDLWSLPAASRSICAKLWRAQAVAVDWGRPIGGRLAIITK
jgi:hypothetical protein